MPDKLASSRSLAWSGYWQSGSPHSCVGSFGQAYGGCIGGFWERTVRDMQAGHRVLDIGTGNGPLPRLIADRSAADAPSIDAVDAADIRPDWWNPGRYPRIRFHGRIGADRMPFESGSFDWLISQYGFEYAPRNETLAECRRVLAPGGRVAMVLHHCDSVICRVGAAELDHHRFLFADGGLIDAAAQVIPFFAKAAAHGPQSVMDDPGAASARERYNAAMTAIAARIESLPHGDVLNEARRSVHALVRAAGTRPLETVLESLHGYAGQLRAAQVRIADMLEHALDEAEVASVCSALAGAGKSADAGYAPLRQQEGLMGWALEIR